MYVTPPYVNGNTQSSPFSVIREAKQFRSGSGSNASVVVVLGSGAVVVVAVVVEVVGVVFRLLLVVASLEFSSPHRGNNMSQ